MYKSIAERLIKTDEELLEDLLQDNRLNLGKTAIFAGHYMLLYHSPSHSLFPAVKEEHPDDSMEFKKVINKTAVGSFPLRTFELGLALVQRLSGSKIILLVNDEKYRTEAITDQELKELDSKGGDKLRQAFYKEDTLKPTIYKKLIDDLGKSISEVIQINTDKERQKSTESILASPSPYFSERVLNRKFNNSTVDVLLKENKLFCTNPLSGKEIRFKSKRRNPRSNYCVISDKTSPCIATSLQLFYELFKNHNYSNIIMMIPQHCKESVDQAAEIILNVLDSAPKTIKVISNLGDESTDIIVKEHLNEADRTK